MRLLILPVLFVSAAWGQTYAEAFEGWLTGQAEGHWERREKEVAGLSSGTEIRARQEYVRRTVMDLIGGLPAEKTPLRAQVSEWMSWCRFVSKLHSQDRSYRKPI